MMQLTVKTLLGEALEPIEVDSNSTVEGLKAMVSEKIQTPSELFALYRGSKYLAVAKCLGEAGLTDGDTLSIRSRAEAPQRAQARVDKLVARPKRGGVSGSVKYDIRAAKEDVIDTVCDEGAQTRGVAQECLSRVQQTKDILMGKPMPRDAGQTAEARLNQLRTQKRLMDNEIGPLAQQVALDRVRAKAAAAQTLQSQAELTDGAVQLVVDVGSREELDTKKKEWMETHKAMQKVLSARAKQFRDEEQKAAKLLSQTTSTVGSVANADGSVARTDAKGRGKSVGYAGSKRARRL